MDEKTISKKSKWSIDGATLTITMPDKASRSFDLARIMPLFDAQDENIRFVFQYGVKQNLSDEIAGQKDASSETKLDLMDSRFEELVRGEIKTKREKADMVGKQKFIDAAMEFGATQEQAEKKWADMTAKK